MLRPERVDFSLYWCYGNGNSRKRNTNGGYEIKSLLRRRLAVHNSKDNREMNMGRGLETPVKLIGFNAYATSANRRNAFTTPPANSAKILSEMVKWVQCIKQ
ncbi:unnamed protein product [Nesidiocoris tenuis]|uniref:Uncharacterized protein n=1 Tax=Nesidiocoris tenuis TaxID=355587 RepID=A0A6H5GWY3_9HEMI|nr:unnamed protein product [Nesidiocoris tenuis]